MYTLDEFRDIYYFKNNHRRLYYFGLGFIQLVLDDSRRFHFYHPDLPAITEDIHNHRYNFTSYILKGSITNTMYEEIEGDKYIIQAENCSKEKRTAIIEPRMGDFKKTSSTKYNKGSYYTMEYNKFHTVNSNNCITLLIRGAYETEYALVAYKNGTNKVCPFSLDVPEDDLWDYINEMLKVD